MTHRDPAARPRGGWVRLVGVAAAVALVGFLAIGPLGLLDGGPGDVGAPADTTVPEPAEPTDTAPAISDTTAAPISLPSILVATGSEVVGGFDGETAADVPAPIAFDDLADGLVYQEASAWFSETAGTDIVHLPEGATGPVVLRAQEGDAAMRLMGVFDVEGASVAVVVERRNPGVVEEATEVMLEIDLSTGMTRDLAAVGGWESGPVAVSWDGEKYVVATVAEGSSYLHTLDRDGKSIPWFGELGTGCFDGTNCPHAVATPDGARLVFLRGTIDAEVLVVWDRESDAELFVIDVPDAVPFGAPLIVGGTVVVNFYEGGGPELGRAVVVNLTDMSLGEVAVAGFADPTSVVTGLEGVVETVPDVSAPGESELIIDGRARPDAEVCAGADGAIVFVLPDGSRAMVGFEEGTFIRYIDATGEASESGEVSVTVDQDRVVYGTTLDIAGEAVTFEIVAGGEPGTSCPG